MLKLVLIFSYCLRLILADESNTTDNSYDYLKGKGKFTKIDNE